MEAWVLCDVICFGLKLAVTGIFVRACRCVSNAALALRDYTLGVETNQLSKFHVAHAFAKCAQTSTLVR